MPTPTTKTKPKRKARRRRLTPEAASALAKKRWDNTPPEDRRKALAEVQAKRDMSPEARAAIGKRLAEARAARKRAGVDFRTLKNIKLGKVRDVLELPQVERKKRGVRYRG